MAQGEQEKTQETQQVSVAAVESSDQGEQGDDTQAILPPSKKSLSDRHKDYLNQRSERYKTYFKRASIVLALGAGALAAGYLGSMYFAPAPAANPAVALPIARPVAEIQRELAQRAFELLNPAPVASQVSVSPAPAPSQASGLSAPLLPAGQGYVGF